MRRGATLDGRRCQRAIAGLDSLVDVFGELGWRVSGIRVPTQSGDPQALVAVHTTGDIADKAATGGCPASPCSAGYLMVSGIVAAIFRGV